MLKNDRFVVGFEGLLESFECPFIDSIHSVLVRFIRAMTIVVVVWGSCLVSHSVLSPTSRALYEHFLHSRYLRAQDYLNTRWLLKKICNGSSPRRRQILPAGGERLGRAFVGPLRCVVHVLRRRRLLRSCAACSFAASCRPAAPSRPTIFE